MTMDSDDLPRGNNISNGNKVCKALLKYIKENSYLCPDTRPWTQFWNLLQRETWKEKSLNREDWQDAPKPIYVGALRFSKNTDPHYRFMRQLAWSVDHDVIGKADKYLRELKPEEWVEKLKRK